MGKSESVADDMACSSPTSSGINCADGVKERTRAGHRVLVLDIFRGMFRYECNGVAGTSKLLFIVPL